MSRASMLHCSTREPSLSRGVEGDKRGQKPSGLEEAACKPIAASLKPRCSSYLLLCNIITATLWQSISQSHGAWVWALGGIEYLMVPWALGLGAGWHRTSHRSRGSWVWVLGGIEHLTGPWVLGLGAGWHRTSHSPVGPGSGCWVA